MKISLAQMRAFTVLADCLNFTVAAQRLHVTQPTLSTTIHNLEDALGARLFDRDTRKVRLTAFGQDSLQLMGHALIEADRAERELREIVKGQRGVVRMAALPQLFREVLREPLAGFRAEHPKVRLDVRDVDSEEALTLLRRGSVDLALVLRVTEDPDLRHEELGEQVLVAVLPGDHPLARRRRIRWQELAREQLVVVHSSGSVGSQINRSLTDAGIQVSWTHRVNQVVTAGGLVEAGFGIGVMSNHSAQHLVSATIVVREVTQPRLARPLCLMTRAGYELPPAASALRARLLAARPGARQVRR